MTRWDDTYIYNWIGWMRSVYNLREKINQLADKHDNFPIFFLNMTLGSVVMYILIGLMAIPQTFEWIMGNVVELIDRIISVNDNNNIDTKAFRAFIGIVMAFALILPYTLTWCLPDVVLNLIKRRKEKRLKLQQELLNNHREAVNESLRQWAYNTQRRREEILERQIRTTQQILDALEPNKITPKKTLKAHKFDDKPEVVVPVTRCAPVVLNRRGRIAREMDRQPRGYYNNLR